MQLTRYLKSAGLSAVEFAAVVGVSPTTVYRWISGNRFPLRHLDKIARVTKGKVTANDFCAAQRGDA